MKLQIMFYLGHAIAAGASPCGPVCYTTVKGKRFSCHGCHHVLGEKASVLSQ